eukprot:6759894-Pyramimonas_sp.AAC.1
MEQRGVCLHRFRRLRLMRCGVHVYTTARTPHWLPRLVLHYPCTCGGSLNNAMSAHVIAMLRDWVRFREPQRSRGRHG